MGLLTTFLSGAFAVGLKAVPLVLYVGLGAALCANELFVKGK